MENVQNVFFFGRSSAGRGSQSLGHLVNKPVNRFKKALDIFKAHQNSHYHQFSMTQTEGLHNVVNVY